MKKTHPGLLMVAIVVVPTVGLYFMYSNVVSDPQGLSVAVKKLRSTEPSVHVRPETDYDLAVADQELSFFRAKLTEIQKVDAKTNQLNGELNKLRRELALLQERVEALSIENDSEDALSKQAHPFDANQSPEDPLQLDAEQMANEELERMMIMDRMFQAEPTDEQWSYNVTQMVTDVFRDIDAMHTTLSRVQCRSTLCLVEVEHSDAEAAEEFDLYFPINVGEALPQANYYTENFDDGSSRVTMYFAREGYDLPQVGP